MPSGKVRKRGEKWYLDIHTGRKKPNGAYERIQRKSKGETKAEATAELAKELYHIEREKEDVGDNVYLTAEICRRYMEHVRRDQPNKKTAENYCWLVEIFRQTFGVERVDQITPAAVETTLHALLDAGRSTNIANKTVDKFRAALDYAVENGWIASNPISKVRHLKKVRVKFRRDLTQEEAQALFAIATPTWKPFWFAALSTAAREAELIYLRVEDVDLSKRTIRIRARAEKGLKTDAAERTIPISEELAGVLSEIMPKEGYVFGVDQGEKPRQNNILREFRRQMRRALETLGRTKDQIEEDLPLLDIHSLRYTAITELIAAGADPKTVQAIAGHKDVKTTLGIYAQSRQSRAVEAIAKLPYKFFVTNSLQESEKKPVSP